MNFNDDTGSAVIELLLFGLVLQLPLLMFSIQLSDVQAKQFAVESAARHSMRSFVLFAIPVEETINSIMTEFGVNEKPEIEFTCIPDCTSSEAQARLVVKLGSATASSQALVHR